MSFLRFIGKLNYFYFVVASLFLHLPANAAHLNSWEARIKPLQSSFSDWNQASKLSLPREFQGWIEYRSKFVLSERDPRDALAIYLGQVGDVDRILINGVTIGQTGSFPPAYQPHMDTFREYLIAPAVLKPTENEIVIETYVEYVAQKGVNLSEIKIGSHDDLQRMKYTKECLWYFLKLGVPFLCLFMALVSMPWTSPSRDFRANFLLFLTGFFYFLFGLGKSRVIFHFLSPLLAYKVTTVSALSGLVCIFVYSIDLCFNRIRRWWPYLLSIGIPFIFGFRILLGLSLADTSLVVKDWLVASIPLNLAVSLGVLFYSVKYLKLKNFWLLSGVFLLAIVAINDVLYNLRILPTVNLMDFGFCGFITLMLIADAVKVRKSWVELDSKKRTLEAAEWYSRKALQVAHDIKSPMQSILKGIEEIESRPSFVRGSDSRAIKVIKEGASRMTEVAQEIQADFKKVDREQSLRVFRSILLDELVWSAVKEASRTKPDGVTLEVNGLASSRNIWSSLSPGGVRTAISNILNNSFESFAMHTSKPRVTVLFSCSVSDATIEIRDNGVGMSSEVLGKVFDEQFTYGKANGTGLGLTQAKNEIEANGGTIEIRSIHGSGTTASIRLPISAKPEFVANEIMLKRKTPIYFVDDDSTVVSFWKEKLKDLNKEDYSVNFLYSLDELPKKTSKDSILVLDQFFGAGALKATDWIKKYKPRSEIYICSNDYESIDLQDFAEQEKVLIIPKPILGEFRILSC